MDGLGLATSHQSDFSATLRAYTYPEEFLPYEGIMEDQSGFFVADQPRGKFGLSYRTEIADDIVGFERGYKIHVLYNLTAIPSNISYTTLSLDTEPFEFEWNISAIPEEIENFRPTAHVILDSRKFNATMLEDIENILYGDEDHDAHLPPLKALSSYIRKWDRFIVTDFGDGTWSAESRHEGEIVMLDDITFEITVDTAVYLDAVTYTISSSGEEETP